MINRRKAREYAFILLFEYKFQPEEINTILEDFFSEYKTGEQEEYIRSVVEGVINNLDEIDELISSYSKKWSVDRISIVCMALMRLAVYEMCFIEDIPLNVSVNEAVNLTKLYDGEESVSFVNGILGNIKESCK